MSAPRALLQTRADGSPITPCIAAAWEALRFLGYDCAAFEALPDVGDAIVVGSVQSLHAAFAQLGVERPPPIDYPESLRPWFGREIRRATLPEAHAAVKRAPVFVKPVRPKVFTGDVYDSSSDLYDATAHLDEHEPVWISEPIDFASEYRGFVRDGFLSGIRHYRGDPWVLPDRLAVIQMARASAAMGLAGFSIDVGVTKDGRTLLVECNDGYALGYYGLDSLLYADLLIARWNQITGRAAPAAVPDDEEIA